MTKTERLILRNQYAIMEMLLRVNPEVAGHGNTIYHDVETYRWYQRALEDGYDVLVSQIGDEVRDVNLTSEEQGEILDILDMYRDLQFGFSQLEDKGSLSADDLRFPGFDGNSSKGELSFAKAFCYRSGTWPMTDAKPDLYDMIEPSPAVNSHGNTMPMYRRMLAVYEPMRLEIGARMTAMTYEEILKVLQAKGLPAASRN